MKKIDDYIAVGCFTIFMIISFLFVIVTLSLIDIDSNILNVLGVIDNVMLMFIISYLMKKQWE